MKTNSTIISQFGVTEADGKVYKVVRGFLLDTVLGPPREIKIGTLVLLSPKTAVHLFYSCMVEPLEISETFEVILPFITVQNGEWLNLDKGDQIKLSRDEAIPLLRGLKIKERRTRDEVTS